MVTAVIFLFVAVSFQPIIAKDTISPVKKSDTKELIETIKDLANNKEIQNIIQKYEGRGNLLESRYLKVRLQKEIISIIEKNDALNWRLKQLSDTPCDCEKNNKMYWNFPILCISLYLIELFLVDLWLYIVYKLNKVPPPFLEALIPIIYNISERLNCWMA